MISQEFKLFLIVFLNFFLSLKILLIFKNKKSFYALDIPNERSSHKSATPSSGGIIFVISGFLVFLLSGNILPLVCTPLALVGYFDDKFNLKATTRYLVQFITSILILLVTNNFRFNSIYELLFTIFLIIAGTGIINIINFMDGIDGLVISTFIIILIPFALIESNYFFILISSLLAFLFFNWEPAKIFMGDIGSTYLGAIFFGILLSFNKNSYSLMNLAIASSLLLDGIICILRRYINGENIFKSHNKHIYQRLFQAGLKHSQISIIYSTLTFILLIIFFLKIYQLMILGILGSIIFGVYLEKYICIPFNNKTLK